MIADARYRERYIIADRLGMAVEDLNQRVGVSELEGWRHYLRWQDGKH